MYVEYTYISFLAGTSIDEAAHVAVHAYVEVEHPIKFNFNGCVILVTELTTKRGIINYYNNFCAEESRKFREKLSSKDGRDFGFSMAKLTNDGLLKEYAMTVAPFVCRENPEECTLCHDATDTDKYYCDIGGGKSIDELEECPLEHRYVLIQRKGETDVN